MKLIFTFFITVLLIELKAQPILTTSAANKPAADKKDLAFAKRKSAFDDKNAKPKPVEPPKPVIDVKKIYTIGELDEEVEYKNGFKEFIKTVRNNLKPDVPVNNQAPQGKYPVKLAVIFNELGVVQSITPTTNFGYGMEEEAVRVFKISEKNWLPAKFSKTNVSSIKEFTITFEIAQENIE
jgi:hypothetical protein